jgi:hypothetical protein
MVSNDAGSYTLVKAEAAAGGAEGQPFQGYSSQRQLSTKVSGPTLAAASTPRHREALPTLGGVRARSTSEKPQGRKPREFARAVVSVYGD